MKEASGSSETSEPHGVTTQKTPFFKFLLVYMSKYLSLALKFLKSILSIECMDDFQIYINMQTNGCIRKERKEISICYGRMAYIL
jgi:hypothetical protein